MNEYKKKLWNWRLVVLAGVLIFRSILGVSVYKALTDKRVPIVDAYSVTVTLRPVTKAERLEGNLPANVYYVATMLDSPESFFVYSGEKEPGFPPGVPTELYFDTATGQTIINDKVIRVDGEYVLNQKTGESISFKDLSPEEQQNYLFTEVEEYGKLINRKALLVSAYIVTFLASFGMTVSTAYYYSLLLKKLRAEQAKIDTKIQRNRKRLDDYFNTLYERDPKHFDMLMSFYEDYYAIKRDEWAKDEESWDFDTYFTDLQTYIKRRSEVFQFEEPVVSESQKLVDADFERRVKSISDAFKGRGKVPLTVQQELEKLKKEVAGESTEEALRKLESVIKGLDTYGGIYYNDPFSLDSQKGTEEVKTIDSQHTGVRILNQAEGTTLGA